MASFVAPMPPFNPDEEVGGNQGHIVKGGLDWTSKTWTGLD